MGCCQQVNKRVKPVEFKSEFIHSISDIAGANGKADKKLNASQELKRLGVEFSTILPYCTSKSTDKAFEDRGIACIQDRMIQREKQIVAELVRKGRLDQDHYLEKDGSLEYRSSNVFGGQHV